MTKKKPAPRTRRGSGNVFRDLGLPEPEELLAKAELTRSIAGILKSRKLTQTRAAEILGVDQPKVSALLNGRLQGFSADRLLRFLVALGQDIEISIRPRPGRRGKGRIKVVG
jgi:predicted XRE-type DNA-binding protein